LPSIVYRTVYLLARTRYTGYSFTSDKEEDLTDEKTSSSVTKSVVEIPD
jgi:hypothetical protein